MPGNAWNLNGKSVLITGAARGIGAETARLALLTPDIFQLAVERMARRNRWANAIQQREQVSEGRKATTLL